MLGLKELYIELDREGVFLATDSEILDPMRVITGVQNFEVELTWHADYDWCGVPFRLRRFGMYYM